MLQTTQILASLRQATPGFVRFLVCAIVPLLLMQPLSAAEPDPTLAFSTYLGGAGNDFGEDIAVDNAGNIYVTKSTNFTNAFTTNPFSSPANQIFVSKFDPSGTTELYSFALGTGTAFGITVDAEGAAYVAGMATNITTVSAIQANNAGLQDAFIAKINPAGTALVYSTYLGGSNNDYAFAIALDALKNVYVVGLTESNNFPLHEPFQATKVGIQSDTFIARLNAAGSALVYSTYFGGSANEVGMGIAVDNVGNAYITGSSDSNNFPVVAAYQSERATCQPTSPDCDDAYVAKFSPAGVPVYSTYLGGDRGERGMGIAIDSSGNSYIVGYTDSTNFPTVNAYQPTSVYPYSSFVTKFDPAGLQLLYSTYLGAPTGVVMGTDIAVDVSGRAYLTGITEATDFPTAAPIQANQGGLADLFITALDPDGLSLSFSSYFGGSDDDGTVANSPRLTVDQRGIYITSSTHSNDFPLKNAFQSQAGGAVPIFGSRNFDAFIVKIAFPPVSLPAQATERNYFSTHTPTLTWKPVSWALGYRVQVDKSLSFTDPLDFEGDVGANADSITTDFLYNGFYYWRVLAQKPDGSWGNISPVDSFTIDAD